MACCISQNRRGDSDGLTTILNGALRTGFDRSYKITEMVVKYCIWNPKDSSKVACKVANIRRGILREGRALNGCRPPDVFIINFLWLRGGQLQADQRAVALLRTAKWLPG